MKAIDQSKLYKWPCAYVLLKQDYVTGMQIAHGKKW